MWQAAPPTFSTLSRITSWSQSTRSSRTSWALPDSYAGYAFLSYESQPLPTKHVSAADVVRFRDEAWQTYFKHQPYLELVEKKFGSQERRNVEEMAKIQLCRKLLGD